MGDVIPVDDVVVPIAAPRLQHGALELERALPRAGLGRVLVLGERQLPGVVVPGAEEVDGLDGGGGAEGEAELDGGHGGGLVGWWGVVFLVFLGWLIGADSDSI